MIRLVSRLDETPSIWDENLPDPGLITDEWSQTTSPRYAELIEAEPVADDQSETLSAAIAAGILISAWLFDLSQGVYLKPRTRQPLTDEEMNFLRQERVSAVKDQLNQISRRYQAGEISRDEWSQQAEAVVCRHHAQMYLLGRGGLGQCDRSDIRTLLRLLKEQRDYLQKFRNDLQGMSDLRAQNRLRLYADSAIAAFWQGLTAAKQAAGFTESRRFLGDAEHCQDCIDYQAMGWQPIGVLPPPCQESECLMYCKCTLRFR
jgi:hypothetical protein